MHTPLFDFLYSEKAFSFIHHYRCGWMDGGCFILARALQIWLGGDLAALIRVSMRYEQTADHFVLGLQDMYIDAEGVHTHKSLIHRWNRNIFLDGPTILENPADIAWRLVGILKNDAMSWELAHVLRGRFSNVRSHNLSAVLGSARY